MVIMKKTNLLVLISFLGFQSLAQAGLLLNYSQLALKDLDQMSKLTQNKITESRKAGGDKIIPLKEALQAVYSRPNEDLMIEKVITAVRSELEEHDAWEKTVQALVKESMGALKNPKAFSPVVQVTYLIFLENILSEMKPKAGEAFENKIINQIKNAKISITKSAENERRLRVMKGTNSPSEIADNILKELAATKSTEPEAVEKAEKN